MATIKVSKFSLCIFPSTVSTGENDSSPLLGIALYCILRCMFVHFNLLGSSAPLVMTFTCFRDDE